MLVAFIKNIDLAILAILVVTIRSSLHLNIGLLVLTVHTGFSFVIKEQIEFIAHVVPKHAHSEELHYHS